MGYLLPGDQGLRLPDEHSDWLVNHYTGNCTGCRDCDFYDRISRREPGALAAYARYLKKKGAAIELVPDDREATG